MDGRKRITTILCRICLRLGNRLRTKGFDEHLVQLHDEMCDYDVFEVPILSFCSICEYQLRKFYNFRQKCRRAHMILKTKKTELRKKNVEYLHMLMPPDPIGYLTAGARQGVLTYFSDMEPPLNQNGQESDKATELMTENTIKIEYDPDLDAQSVTDDTETKSKPDDIDTMSKPDDDNAPAIYYEPTSLEVLCDTDGEDDEPLSKCLIRKNNASDSYVKQIKNSKRKPAAPIKTQKAMLTKEHAKFVSKMKTMKSKKRISKAERVKLELKDRVLRLIDEGNLGLGDDTTITKEQFLKMFAKCDLNRLRYRGLFKKDNRESVTLKKFLRYLYRRFSPEYETVFDIEYLSTRDSKLAQFRARKDTETYLTAEFKCEKCYKCFEKRSSLNYHSKWHDPDLQYACDICSMRFSTHRQLVKHLNITHSAVYRCKLCDVVTYDFAAMVTHYHQHKGVKYNCNDCSAEFRSSSALNAHRKSHATHECPHCPQRYFTQNALQYHSRLKHSAHSVSNVHLNKHKGERPHACSVCPARFSKRSQLLTHRHRHRPPKHGCDYCAKRFTSSANLRLHRRTHMGERRFKCDICFKGFLHSGALKEHISRVHQVRRIKKKKGTQT